MTAIGPVKVMPINCKGNSWKYLFCPVAIICDRVWEKGTFRAKIEFLISGTRG